MTEAKVVSWQEWADKVNKQLQGHQQEIARLKNEVETLDRKLRPLQSFWMKRQILITLHNEGKPRSWSWLWRRLGCDAWEPLRELEREGMVVVTRSGTHEMYVAKEG